MTEIIVTIPGTPYAQKRHRSRVRQTKGGKAFTQQHDHPENVDWKAYAQTYFALAMNEAGLDDPLVGAIELIVVAVFPMPRSRWLKTKKRRGGSHTKKPDIDNLLKAIEDAGNGVLWVDDKQIWKVDAMKLEAPQEEPGRLFLRVVEEP
jgi:Holliday junction resolvase RusA-like endonuclease